LPRPRRQQPGRSESRPPASTGSSLPGAGEIVAVLSQMAFAIAV
jgi:hypothetical protein